LEEGVPGRTAPAVFGFPQRGEFPFSKLSSFCFGGIQKYAEHLRNQFFCSSGISFTQSTMWVFFSVGNPPPRGNPGLKCTRTDDILKKLVFKINLNEK
jgi:hypothetical protein